MHITFLFVRRSPFVQIDKLEQLVSRVKEKYLELKNDQQQTVEDEIKRSLAFLVQRLKRKIRPNKQTTGANFLSKTLAIMKKSIVKFLSSDEQSDEEDSSASDQSEEPDDQTNIVQSTLQTNDLQTTSQEQIVEQSSNQPESVLIFSSSFTLSFSSTEV